MPTKKKLPKRETIDDVGAITAVARMLGCHPKTIENGVRAGHVEARILGDGSTRVVLIESARAWAQSARKPGPRPAK